MLLQCGGLAVTRHDVPTTRPGVHASNREDELHNRTLLTTMLVGGEFADAAVAIKSTNPE